MCYHIETRPNVSHPTTADVLANTRTLCGFHDRQMKENRHGDRGRGGKPALIGSDADGWPISTKFSAKGQGTAATAWREFIEPASWLDGSRIVGLRAGTMEVMRIKARAVEWCDGSNIIEVDENETTDARLVNGLSMDLLAAA